MTNAFRSQFVIVLKYSFRGSINLTQGSQFETEDFSKLNDYA